MIKRLAPRAAREQSAGDVYHVRRKFTFVRQRCATTTAKAACGARSFVFVASDNFLAVSYAKALAPATDIGGIGRAVRKPACVGMIVPSPACREINLQTNRPAETESFDWLNHDGRHRFAVGVSVSRQAAVDNEFAAGHPCRTRRTRDRDSPSQCRSACQIGPTASLPCVLCRSRCQANPAAPSACRQSPDEPSLPGSDLWHIKSPRTWKRSGQRPSTRDRPRSRTSRLCRILRRY